MMFTIQRLLALAACLTSASAQTLLSTVPVVDGNTVIISVSTDLVGNTVPVAVGTVTDPGLSTPIATTTAVPVPGVTTTPVPVTTAAPTVTSSTPRVVGAPGPTDAGGPTVYTYMTTDANGQPTRVVDTYTPAYGVTSIAYTPKAGSIIPYDQYTSMYGSGSNDGGSVASNSATRQSAAFGLGVTAVICVLGGVTLLL